MKRLIVVIAVLMQIGLNLNAQSVKSDSLFALGVDLYNAGKYKEAIPIFEDCYYLDKVELDEENFCRFYSEMWVGACYNQLGDSITALDISEYYKYPVDRRKTMISDSLLYLGRHFYKVNEYKTALNYYRKGAEIEKKILGVLHPWHVKKTLLIYTVMLTKMAVDNYNKGHYEEAIDVVKNCITMKDPFVRINAMELLAELYELTDDKGEALEVKKQADSYKDSVMTINHSLEIADWQRKYDEERWEEKSQRKMMEMAGVTTFIILAILAIGVWWHHRRVKALGFKLDEHARRMTENLMEMERLQESGEASEQTIAELNRQIEASRQRISNKLLVGTRCFVRMQQKECIADLTSEERQCLIDYFALLRPKRWQEWEHTYASLTTAQYVFLILQDDLHYDDDTIAKILNVKPASLRTLRSRIKGREK